MPLIVSIISNLDCHMNKPLKIALITLSLIIGIPVLLLSGYVFLMADFFSGPNEKTCVKMTERFLGCKLGKDYEFLEYDVDFSHPDRPLSFSIKLPSQRFQKVIDFCKEEASKGQNKIIQKDGDHDTYTQPIHKTVEGYQKFEEVRWQGDRVHYKSLDIIVDERIVVFSWMDY